MLFNRNLTRSVRRRVTGFDGSRSDRQGDAPPSAFVPDVRYECDESESAPLHIGSLPGYLAGIEESLWRSSAFRALANGSISTRGSTGESTNPRCR